MANRKISDLTSLTAPATGDLLPIVDISEAAAADKNKKITYGELLASAPAGTAAAPSFSFDGDPNSGLYSAGADQVAITTGGTGRLFIDSSGRLLAGTSTARSNFFGTTLSSVAQIEGTGGAGGRGALSVINNDVSNNPPYVLLGRSGAASLGSNAVVVSGSRLGTLTFHGADGTSFIEAATVAGEVDGTPGSNDMPGRLVFSTTADGAASPTERLRIDSSGRVGIGTSAPAGKVNILGSTAAPSLTYDTADVVNIDAGTIQLAIGVNSSAPFGAYFQGRDNGNGSRIISLNPAGGNVGIGTTSPTGFLHVKSPATTAGWQLRLDSVGLANESGFFRTATDNYEMVLRNGLGGLSYITNTGGASTSTLEFNVQGSERARIDSAGRLLVGTSSITLGSPQAIIEKSTSDLDILRVQCGALETSSNLAGIAFGHGPSGARPKVAIASVATGSFGKGSLAFFIDQAGDNNSVSSTDEVARIDSSGRLLVGTSSTSFSLTAAFQGNSGNTAGAAVIHLRRGEAAATITSAEILGVIRGTDNADNTGAEIQFVADGIWGASDYPTRITFSTVTDGSGTNTERLRITNDGVIAHDQPAPAAVNATATLTVANLKAGIITSTSAAATDMTLPTGTDTQAGFFETYDNFTFEWSVINTGPSLVRVLAGTAHTVVGSGSVATGTSGRFASRRTAANTFVSYRLA